MDQDSQTALHSPIYGEMMVVSKVVYIEGKKRILDGDDAQITPALRYIKRNHISGVSSLAQLTGCPGLGPDKGPDKTSIITVRSP